MRRSAWPLPVLLAFLPSAAAGFIFGEVRELYPTTPDEVIVKRATGNPPPIWQIPLGPALVEDMQLLGSDRLLVSLRKDFPGLPNLDTILVDTVKGKVLWRYSRDKLEGQYRCLLILQDLLLYRVDQGKTTSLVGLDTRTGLEKWTVRLNGERVKIIPFMTGGSALAISPGLDSVELTALDLDGGRTLWRKSFRVANGVWLPVPQVVGEDLLVFYNGLERLSSKDGKSVFSRPDLVFDAKSPPPQIEDGVLWAVHSDARLSALDIASGKDLRTVALPRIVRYTNIYPLGEGVYLRGFDEAGLHQMCSLRRADGKILWTYSGAEPSISNLIESGDRLFFGTPTSLVALNAQNGKQVFSSLVTTTGRAFPIRLRKINDRIVYIGELVVAAFDAKTGKTVYTQGMTPGSGELHLNGLDAAAPNLKKEMAKAEVNPAGDQMSSRSNFATLESEKYANLSRSYASQERDIRHRAERGYIGDDMYKADIARMKKEYAQHEARLQAKVALAYAVADLGFMIHQLFIVRSIKTSIERQGLFRESILASYAQSEAGEYVYRPNLVIHGFADTFNTVSVVHLPTGRRTETTLSPSYLSYGLWQAIDFEKGVVYHSNIGMDPSRYQLSESRAYYPYSDARTVNTFLIAQPVKIPR